MPRRPRIDIIGYYHIINRGVARSNIFLNDIDKDKFLKILNETCKIYHFNIHSFCLMDNHYHFLLETTDENLSLLMRQINSRYAIYFNKKYNRVGPLWQGRFKSWYVYNESYLFTLVKYIEQNATRANISTKAGEDRYASSYYFISGKIPFCLKNSLCLRDFKLNELKNLLDVPISENDEKVITKIHSARFKKEEGGIIKEKNISLKEYFTDVHDKDSRDKNIIKAFYDGYKQAEIAKYLGLSTVAISKILRIYKEKRALFDKLKSKGIFWSYAKDISFGKLGEEILIEYTLKYGDFDDVKVAFAIFGKKRLKKVWKSKIISDKRFKKLNYFLARMFFDMKVEADYFEGLKNERFEKLRLLASKDKKIISRTYR
ncbi:MAG: transposase [Desulfurellaceae bacterium]|nr:transposase [Desulfurellaceae bacterium]